MSRILLVLAEPLATSLARELELDGVPGVGCVPPERFTAMLADGVGTAGELAAAFAAADIVVLPARADTVTATTVAFADRHGARLIPVGREPAAARLAAMFGLAAPLDETRPPRDLAREVVSARPVPTVSSTVPRPRTIVVWGPHGAPGRTTLAVCLATELARSGRHVALVDADAHAPSIALALGLPDEGPGFAMACRQAELGALDEAELHRISLPMGGADVDVFCGINRPTRWPELSAGRVRAALGACAGWAQHTVVDVAASLERDEEIVSDLLDGPRRNASTLAALEQADHIVAVLAADPVGVARFLRAHSELRAIAGATPVTVVVNRLRAGVVGVDTRRQIRRTLARYADVRDPWFLPDDRRAADAATLAARPASEVAPRSALVAAVRRVVGGAFAETGPAASQTRSTGTRRVRAAPPAGRRRTADL